MRIVIATVQVPFIYGGAEYHARNLKKALIDAGYEVDIVTTLFKWYPPERIVEHILACRLLDLSESTGQAIDMLIGLRFPAYYIFHHNKVIWLLHQHREAYELWGTEFGGLHHYPNGETIREIIKNCDNKFLREAKKIYANSKNVAQRLKKFNNIYAEPLYHPPPDYEKFYCDNFDNYLLFISRLSPIKRQHLAIEAMKLVKAPVKLIIVGSADNNNYQQYLLQLTEKNGLKEKVLFLGNINKEQKLKLFANALGVLFIPFDEDYGYVTLEAFYSHKPVITCKDSGGPLEFVEDNVNGFIVLPHPETIAEAIEKLSNNIQMAKKMGKAGYEKLKALNISWKNVVTKLTQ